MMRTISMLGSTALLLLATASAPQEAQPSEPAPPAGHRTLAIEGWRVHVDLRLLEEQRALGAEALAELENQLYRIRRVVPEAPLAKLRAVPIFLGVEDEHGRHPCACYHPSREWLVAHGYPAEKERSVDLANATNFVAWTREVQPWMVLHELAHAYHHQVLGHEHAELLAAYEQALASGRYDAVLYARGGRQRHYALQNAKEYFAEGTEAFFGTNDFQPFVRAELQDLDPVLHALLEKIWR
jgi:hypothetical protein